MSLFDEDLIIEFTEREWELYMRPVNGRGGADILLRKLHSQNLDGRRVRIEISQIDKCHHYAYSDGPGGGYQDRFKAIMAAARRAGWSPDGMRPPKKRNSGGAFGRKKDLDR